MPISNDRFEEIPEDGDAGPTPGTNAAKILGFLRNNADKAFTQSEIAAETSVKPGSVGPTLVRLRERGRVDHRGKYWRISDHDLSDEQTPSYDEWQEYAVNPRDRNADE